MIQTIAAPLDTTRILSYSVPWAETSLLQFLAAFPSQPRAYIESQRGAVSLAGVGATAVLTAAGPHRFQDLRRQSKLLFERIEAAPGHASELAPKLLGGAAFEQDFEGRGFWQGFPAAALVLPRLTLTHSNGQHWLTINSSYDPDSSLHDHIREVTKEFDALETRLKSASHSVNGFRSGPEIKSTPLMSFSEWGVILKRAIGKIHAGEIDKVVLARTHIAQATAAFDPISALAFLGETYPDCYRFLLEPIPGGAFFGASPELLASVHGGTLTTTALAGSAPRGQTEEEDLRLAHELLASSKERQEHDFVVRQIESNLHALTEALDIAPDPVVTRLQNIQHLRTDINGRLHSDVDILDVVEALHPTPAVGGVPRAKALELIKDLETQPRGWYAAPVGWLDADGNGEFIVALRSGISRTKEALLFSGAGIVEASDPAMEWEETERKFRPMLEALQRSL